MNVFVAGATGAIGQPLVMQLIEAGHTVSAVTRSEDRASQLRSQGVDAYVGNALDRRRMSEILKATTPEAIVHELTTFPTTMRPIRTLREWRQTVRLRVGGTRLFVDLAKQIGIRRVVAQSIAFGYHPLRQPRKATEEDRYYGRGPGLMDLLMRHLLRLESTVTDADGVEGVALRYGGWYGPGTHFAPGGLLHQLAMKGRLPIVKGAGGRWNAIQVDDAASATLASLSGPTGVFNVVDDDPLPWNEFITLYADRIGAPTPRTVAQWKTLPFGFYIRHLLLRQPPASNNKAKTELGWKPRYPTFEDGAATLAT
jgi:nucleoside-diphosphate-sugar epimerase